MRTEFLFLESGKTPSEEEQYEVYRDMAKALGGRPLTIRTLDIGGDKQVPHLDLPKEDNSFLGIRGIRLCEPCSYLEQMTAAGIREALVHRGGLRATILAGGTVRPGDSIVAS